MKRFLAYFGPGIGLLSGMTLCPLAFWLSLWAISSFSGKASALYEAIHGTNMIINTGPIWILLLMCNAIFGAVLGAVVGQANFLWNKGHYLLASNVSWRVGPLATLIFGFWIFQILTSHHSFETRREVPFEPIQLSAVLPLLSLALLIFCFPLVASRNEKLPDL